MMNDEDDFDENEDSEVCPDCGEIHDGEGSLPSENPAKTFFEPMSRAVAQVNATLGIEEGLKADINKRFALLVQDYLSEVCGMHGK